MFCGLRNFTCFFVWNFYFWVNFSFKILRTAKSSICKLCHCPVAYYFKAAEENWKHLLLTQLGVGVFSLCLCGFPFLHMLQLPPTVHEHAGRVNWQSKSPVGVNVSVKGLCESATWLTGELWGLHPPLVTQLESLPSPLRPYKGYVGIVEEWITSMYINLTTSLDYCVVSFLFYAANVSGQHKLKRRIFLDS